ncbi:MAG: class I SAM-dependent methyltransferase, partial [Chloroflexota bacterium]
MAGPIVLSHVQAGALLDGRQRGQSSLRTTLDLGVSSAEVDLNADGVAYKGTILLDWDAVRTIMRQSPMCFLVEDGEMFKIHRFSEELNRPYSLMATIGWPTLVNSGFTMHRIVGIDPGQDTQEKIRALGTPRGRVLDTTTGLGYTAIAAARQANEVITVELDRLVLEIARLNPWSRELFENPRISQRIGDSADLIAEFPDRHFTQIIHDPPTLSLAGDLYGGAFYRQLFRVLCPGGTLFHYVGNPASRLGGLFYNVVGGM